MAIGWLVVNFPSIGKVCLTRLKLMKSMMLGVFASGGLVVRFPSMEVVPRRRTEITRSRAVATCLHLVLTHHCPF